MSVDPFLHAGFLTSIGHIVFKHPVALIYLDTQYNSVTNATTPSSPNMFRPKTAIFRCLSYANTSTHKEDSNIIRRRSERNID
jgi:hypothetical protein